MSNKYENPVLKKIQAKVDENKVIAELEQEYDVTEMLEFNEFNIGEKLQWNAYFIEQLRLMCIHERHKYAKLESKFDERTGVWYDYYKYEDSRDLTKTEIEKYYLPKTEELIKLKKLLKLQEIRVSYFEALAEAFKSMSWNMKNFLQNLQIGG